MRSGNPLRLPAAVAIASSLILAVALLMNMVDYAAGVHFDLSAVGRMMRLITPYLYTAALVLLPVAMFMLQRTMGAPGAFKYAAAALAAFIVLGYVLYVLFVAAIYVITPRYGMTPSEYFIFMILPSYLTDIVTSYLVRRSLYGVAVASPPPASKRLRWAGTLYLIGAFLTVAVVGFAIAIAGAAYAVAAFSSLASGRRE